MKKALSLILALIFVFLAVSCSMQPTAVTPTEIPGTTPTHTAQATTPKPTDTTVPTETAAPAVPQMMPTDELQRGIWYGFVPAELQNDLDTQITFSEFGSMISGMMGLIDPDDVTIWQAYAPKVMQMTDGMHRDDAMFVLFMAADSIGQTALRQPWAANWGETQDTIGLRIWSEFSNDYDSYFPQGAEAYPGGWEGQEDFSYILAAYNFSLGEASMISKKPLLDYDADQNSMHASAPFTRKEAILSLVRLYEALEFNIYVPVADAIPMGVSAETLKAAEQMPAASNKELPKWYGSTMNNMSASWGDDGGVGILYWEQDVQNLAKMGINFLRVPLDSELIFQDDSLSQVNNAMLMNMDHLVTWGIENGVHICFDLHSTFGFTTNGDDGDDSLFQNADQQATFEKFWTFMAQRYASVPNNALSFDLLNEPHGDHLNENTYVAVMKKAIEGIRSATPDRLIFVDMFNVATEPIQSLIDTGVAQSVHIYFPTSSNLNPNDTPYSLKATWPFYLINGLVQRNSGPVTLNGDFKAGTTITVRVDGFHSSGKIVARGDGKELGSYAFGEEQVGENYCNSINEEGTGGENRWYNGAGFTFTLAQDTKAIDFRLTGNSQWVYLRGISISHGDDTTLIYASGNIVEKSGSLVLTVAEDGSVTASNPKLLLAMDDNYPDALVKKYSDFSQKNGVAVMVQEFGYDSSSDYNLTLKAMDVQLAAFTKYNLGWCMWGGSYNFVAVTEDWKRDGATYEQIGDNRWVAKEMLDIMKKYMP
jgi:hypothetical protein